MTGILYGEKTRLHKVLTDGGVRLVVVLSDIQGKSGQLMIGGLLETADRFCVLPTNVLKPQKRNSWMRWLVN